MTPSSTLDAAIRRDRTVVVAALAGVTVVSWLWLVRDAWLMYYANGDLPPCCRWAPPWRARLAAVGPGRLVGSVRDVGRDDGRDDGALRGPDGADLRGGARRRRWQQRPYTPTGLFLLGYLLIWLGYSAAATVAQALLHHLALLSPTMVSTSPLLGGLLLVITGLSQWSKLKHACLTHCRSPLEFIMTQWREGSRGAVLMGLHHGLYCTVCCWLLMALMFVLGVMNMAWMAVLTILMLAEKIAPRGHWLANASGVLFLAWGLVLLSTWR